MIGEKKCYLTRENDGKQWEAVTVFFISWNEDRTFSSIHDDLSVGRSIIVDVVEENVGGVGYTNYQWLTTPITEIISETTNEYFAITRVRTENSIYKLLQPKRKKIDEFEIDKK